jgi:hypothetical protein
VHHQRQDADDLESILWNRFGRNLRPNNLKLVIMT